MTAIDELVYVLQEAFSGAGIEESNEGQSFMQNLLSVEGSMWRTVPEGGVRTIESIALHVGSCKVMYDEYAFGPGRCPGATPRSNPGRPARRRSRRRSGGSRTCTDGSWNTFVRSETTISATPRSTNWGELRETRWLISTIAQHDVYHAGEVNHLRSILAASDAWRWG